LTFILQEGIPDNKFGRQDHRLFLDDNHHKGCEVIAEYEAKNWIEAREQVPG
jgi:hypothetical protein